MFLTGTADPWGERSWSRFSAYSMFVKDLGKLNLGQELHGNRSCDFEKCCAISIYSIEIWVGFINLRTEARNNLAIFLRDAQHLKDIYILLWPWSCSAWYPLKGAITFPIGIYLLKVNNRNTRTRCKICSKLPIKIPERRHWLTPLLTLNM